MPITPLPPPPTRSEPNEFAERGDAFLAALPGFCAEANALQEAVNSRHAEVNNAANAAAQDARAAASARDAARASAATASAQADAAVGNAGLAQQSKQAAAVSAASAAASAASAAAIDAAAFASARGDIEQTKRELVSHKSSGDHDGRYLQRSARGAGNGVAPLDADGKLSGNWIRNIDQGQVGNLEWAVAHYGRNKVERNSEVHPFADVQEFGYAHISLNAGMSGGRFEAPFPFVMKGLRVDANSNIFAICQRLRTT